MDSLNEGKLVIRDAGYDDIHSILDIYNQSIRTKRSIGSVDPITMEAKTEWFEEVKNSGMPFWVLTNNEIVAAWICMRHFSPSPYFRHTGKSSLFVDDKYRGCGYGTRLKKRLMERCSEFGISVLISNCFSHNHAMIAINLKLGMEEWGRQKGVANIDGEYRDIVTLGIDFSQTP